MLTTFTAMTEIVLHQMLASYLLSCDASFQFFLLVVCIWPFIMPPWKLWLKLIVFALPLAGYVWIELFIRGIPPAVALDASLLQFLKVSNIILSFVCLGMLGSYFSYAVAKTEEDLDLQHEKSEHLLLNILPRKIAARLKETEQVISDRFAETSILFADIVGFTRLSEKILPEELIVILNNYFSEFDKLVDKYHLEKIKTIGDAYMVASGVPEQADDHALRLAAFALEMLEVSKTCNEQHGYDIEMRVGIHCGPVVAGVIGTKKFAYDLWGDTVNTALRMESAGVPGRIQTSQEFFKLCRNEFVFEERGEIDVKGKGIVKTYFLLGKVKPVPR